MAFERTMDSFSAISGSCCRFFNWMKKMRWPCRCDCIWTVSFSWVCVDNMNRNVTRANRSNQYHETEESDGILEPLGSHRQSIRELPPLPNSDEAECNLGSVTNQICADGEFTQQKPDFWASIEKVKQVGQVCFIH